MYRIGNVPRRPEDSELFQHMWTRKGFFGPYANRYKTQSPGEPIRWDPQGLTQAGARRRTNGAATRPLDVPLLNVNVDVRQRPRLTPEAHAYLRERTATAGARA